VLLPPAVDTKRLGHFYQGSHRWARSTTRLSRVRNASTAAATMVTTAAGDVNTSMVSAFLVRLDGWLL